MADFTVPITIDDNDVADVVAALKWKWAPAFVDENGQQYDPTNTELRARLKSEVQRMLLNVTKQHKRATTVDTDPVIT